MYRRISIFSFLFTSLCAIVEIPISKRPLVELKKLQLKPERSQLLLANLPKLNTDLELFVNVSTGARLTLHASFCNNTSGKKIFENIDGSRVKQLVSTLLYHLKEETKCPGEVDPFYSDSKERLYVIIVGHGNVPLINVDIGIRIKSQQVVRSKRITELENVLLRDFDLHKDESAQYEFKISTYDYGLRLTGMSGNDSEIFVSFCKAKRGTLILNVKSEKFEVVVINSTYIAKIVDENQCEGAKDALLEITRILYLNVVGVKDNSTGTVELRYDLENGESNNTESASHAPLLLASEQVALKKSDVHEFNITLVDLDQGLNFTITVQQGEISVGMKQCENASEVPISQTFKHGYHYMHLNSSSLLDIINKTKCEPTRQKRDILYHDLSQPQSLNVLVHGIDDHNRASMSIFNGFGNPASTESPSNREQASFWDRYSTWIIFAISFLAFLGLSIAAMIYANYRSKQKHWNRRREAMKFLRSASEPGVVHPIRDHNDHINVFEMSSRSWM